MTKRSSAFGGRAETADASPYARAPEQRMRLQVRRWLTAIFGSDHPADANAVATEVTDVVPTPALLARIARHRLAALLPTYFLMYSVCFYAAFLLRFEFAPGREMLALFWMSLPVVLCLKFLLCLATGEWRRTFRYATLRDVFWIGAGAVGAAVLIYASKFVLFRGQPIPKSVILIDASLTILSGGLLRSATRLYTELVRSRFAGDARERAIIFRSDRVGIGILRAIETSGAKYRVIGFVDDSSNERAALLAGLPVLSMQLGWKKLVRKLRPRHVFIPSTVPGKRVREILTKCKDAGMKAHVIPAVDEIVEGRYKLRIREVTISDLLRRETAQLDMDGIRQYITNRRVLVTGAAGSIGSELCRQILDFQPESLVLVDQSELGVFTMDQEFKGEPGIESKLHFVVADVLDQSSMQRVMQVHRPQLVFHAAAYKHVPLMEESPQEAIRNNVFGTKNVVELSHRFGVERFVLISTDKAVKPTSVMGATKFMAEKYLQGMATASATQFITVRFGNVLNSAGSVVPTFRKQIEHGGPITVTHPDMVRFFMTIPEAVQLVLQAGAIGISGDVLILEMGDPVKIVDLAKDMIFMSGLRYPDDIDIVFTGIRPGEKLYEELFYDTENGAKKVHDKIYCAGREGLALSQVQRDFASLQTAVTAGKAEALEILREVVARYVDAEETAASPKLKSAA